MERKVPQRMCVACRSMKDKNLLLRIVKNQSGQIEIDKTFKKNGRGAYICKNETCLKKCQKSRLINRTFKCEISDEVYKQIEEAVNAEG